MKPFANFIGYQLVWFAVVGTLSGLGWIRYAAPVPALPPAGAPLWMLAL